MPDKRKVEIFSAGCPVCEEWIQTIRNLACPSCDVEVRDMKEPSVQERARTLNVKSVPAVAIDGALAECCAAGGPDMDILKRSGLGQPL